MRFVHLADLHLGSRHKDLGQRAEEREREVLESFRRAVTFITDPAHAIDGVLIAGNLFESHRPDKETFDWARGLFGQLHAANKPVWLLPGARDGLGYRDSIYREERLPGVTIFAEPDPKAPIRAECRGRTIWFHAAVGRADVSPTKFQGFQRSADPGLHIGLLSAPLHGSDEFEVRPRVWHVHDGEIASYGLDYVALSGMHGFNAIVSGGRTFGAWPGTLEGRRFEPGDLGPKSLLVVAFDSEGKVRLERHPFSRRHLESFAIDLAKESILDTRDLKSALLARASEDCIARVTLEGPASFLPDLYHLQMEVAHRFFHLELVDRSDLEGGPLVRRIESEKTIRGVYVRRLLRRLADLRAREVSANAEHTKTLARDIEVARRALRLGLEQFLDEGPPDFSHRGSMAQRLEASE